MRKSFAKTVQPMLAGVIKEQTPKSAIAAIKNCASRGATGIDLHLSCLDDEYKNVESISRIINASPLPVLVLNYNVSYGGEIYDDTEENRTDLLLKGVEAGAAAADIQGYTFDLPSKSGFRKEFLDNAPSFAKNNPKEVVVDDAVIAKQKAFIDKVHSMGAEVLLSNHPGIPMKAEQVVELATLVEKRNPDIIKIVTTADTDEEMLEAFKAMVMLKKEIEVPISYHCSGSKGALTRIVNPVLGGFMCFCNERFTHNSDMNQPLLELANGAISNILKITGGR